LASMSILQGSAMSWSQDAIVTTSTVRAVIVKDSGVKVTVVEPVAKFGKS